jgi:protease-4
MGSVAASGGYYISSPAKTIFARENTLTGSIGVVGGKMVVGGALEGIGVKTYEIGRGARASMWSPMRPWTDDERAGVRSMMEQVYEQFLARVSAGRGMERDAVHEVAQGRVWTGVAAKEQGLVDEIGGLDDALAAAAEAGGVSLDAGLQVYPPQPTLRDYLAGFGEVSASQTTVDATLKRWMAAAELVPAAPPAARQLAAVVATLRRLLLLQSARMWAVSWVTPPM